MKTVKFVSPTQLQLFEDCPYLWYLRYVKKYKPPMTFPLKFGIAFHAGVEKMLEGGEWDNRVALDNACTTFDYNYTFVYKGKDETKWMRRAKIMMQLLQNKLSSFDQFEVLEQEQTIQVGTLRGRIDCLAKINGEPYIIDWKTSSQPYSEDELKNSIQLTAYCCLTENKYKPAFMVVPKTGNKVYFQETERTLQEIREFEDYVDSVIKRMESLEEFPKNLYHCTTYGGCPAYKDCECPGRDDF